MRRARCFALSATPRSARSRSVDLADEPIISLTGSTGIETGK
jgi:hypothetical protein